jgi:hypothetical protein
MHTGRKTKPWSGSSTFASLRHEGSTQLASIPSCVALLRILCGEKIVLRRLFLVPCGPHSCARRRWLQSARDRHAPTTLAHAAGNESDAGADTGAADAGDPPAVAAPAKYLTA